MMKFLIEHGVREVKGDQIVARECYGAFLSDNIQSETMMVNKEKAKKVNQTIKLVEDLLEVSLNDQTPDQKVCIRSLLGSNKSKRLIKLLAKHRDIFS